MKEEIPEYLIPKSIIKQDMRNNFMIGLVSGVFLSIITGILCWMFFLL
jgi:hypothetical protein